MEYMVCSTARLSSQLKSVYGWMELIFVSASLDIPLSSNLESVRCSTTANKHGVCIVRNSSAYEYTSFTQWNEKVTFPCCLDWDIEFTVTAKSRRDKEVIATSDLMLIQSTGTLKLPLRIGAKCVGEIEVSLIFHPNYQSFKYLTIGCYLSEQLSYTLTNEILQELNNHSSKSNQVKENEEHENIQSFSLIPNNDILNIIAVVDNFTTFLTNEKSFHGELCLALNIKTNYDGILHKPTNHEDTSGLLLLNKNSMGSDIPQYIPIYRVVSGTMNFLIKLIGHLPQVFI